MNKNKEPRTSQKRLANSLKHRLLLGLVGISLLAMCVLGWNLWQSNASLVGLDDVGLIAGAVVYDLFNAYWPITAVPIIVALLFILERTDKKSVFVRLVPISLLAAVLATILSQIVSYVIAPAQTQNFEDMLTNLAWIMMVRWVIDGCFFAVTGTVMLRQLVRFSWKRSIAISVVASLPFLIQVDGFSVAYSIGSWVGPAWAPWTVMSALGFSILLWISAYVLRNVEY